jgi:sulfite exporter TauE/SafE
MSSTEALYFVFLVTGVAVGFGHCVGMCGPIVISLSLGLKRKGFLLPHLLYNGGRIVTYALLGAVMGATGSFTLVIGNIAPVQKGMMIFAGLIIVFMGIAMVGWIPVGRIFKDYYNPDGIVSRGFRRLATVKSTSTYFPLGLLLGLLPCGPVYTALVAVARAGMDAPDLLEGMLVGIGLMLCFGIGTVPALLVIAKLASLGWLKSREVIYRVSAALMVLVGAWFVVKGIRY